MRKFCEQVLSESVRSETFGTGVLHLIYRGK
jgi:hypothetical protein